MFLGIMEHKKKLQLVHFKSYPNHAPSLKLLCLAPTVLFLCWLREQRAEGPE